MWSTYHEYGTKKKSESPTGIEPMIFHTVVGCSNHWATKDLWWAGPCTRFMYDMRPAYRRISDVEIVMCVINKERWQILSSVKKREMMWSICHGHEMGQRKKKETQIFSFLCSSVVRAFNRYTEGDRVNSYWVLRVFLCPMLVACWSHHFSLFVHLVKIYQWQVQAFKWAGSLALKIGFLTLQAFNRVGTWVLSAPPLNWPVLYSPAIWKIKKIFNNSVISISCVLFFCRSTW